MTQVAGNSMEYGEGVCNLSQQGSEASPCKLLCMRPGREAILATAILAQILFKETIIGPGSKPDAGSNIAQACVRSLICYHSFAFLNSSLVPWEGF